MEGGSVVVRRNRYAAMRRFLIATVAAVAFVTSAFATDRCGRGTEVPIHFEPGKSCWLYHGQGAYFTGKFKPLQTITAKAWYEWLDDHEPGRPQIAFDDVHLSASINHLEMPVSTSNDDRFLHFNTDNQNDQYIEFVVNPCSARHAAVTVEICAVDVAAEDTRVGQGRNVSRATCSGKIWNISKDQKGISGSKLAMAYINAQQKLRARSEEKSYPYATWASAARSERTRSEQEMMESGEGIERARPPDFCSPWST